MRVRRGFRSALTALLAVAALPALTGCDAVGAVESVAVTPLGAKDVPADLRSAGFTGGFRLPQYWQANGYGAAGDGRWLGLTASDDGHIGGPVTGGSTLAIDVVHHLAWAHPLVNAGWYSGAAIAADGWVVHEEKQQLDGSQCPRGDPSDCFIWRLYAARAAGSGAPRLLASSAHPGSQTGSPVPLLTGTAGAERLLWVEGDGDRDDVLRSWRIGDPGAPALVRRLPFYENLNGDGDGAVLISRQDVDSPWTVRTADAAFRELGEFAGRGEIGLDGRRLLVLPVTAYDAEVWRIGTLGSNIARTAASTRPIALSSFDAISVGFLDERTAWLLDEHRLVLLDAHSGAVRATVPMTDDARAIPRQTDSGGLTLVQQTSTVVSVFLRPAG